ncbi:hypothetical protein L7F22_031940 [Adiantum nelumboides]|nr:hypothetical protein [Adiantum nelumboides]
MAEKGDENYEEGSSSHGTERVSHDEDALFKAQLVNFMEKARLRKMKGKEHLFPKLEDMVLEKQPEVEELDEIFVAEQILAHKERKVRGKVARRYLVKFKNYSPMHAKWMEEAELDKAWLKQGQLADTGRRLGKGLEAAETGKLREKRGKKSKAEANRGEYLLLLNKHPVTTKAITSALLTLFGDLVCQLMIEKSETINLTRLGIFTVLGLVLVGPTLHFWYLTLSKLLPGPGTTRAVARLILDQFLFSPIFIGIFISALMTLEGHSYDIVPKLKQDWFTVVLANWKIWIPFQFLNFLFVPQQLQVLAANVIALAWNTYLSFAAHKDIMPPAGKDSFAS